MESTNHDIYYLVGQSFETAAVPGTNQLPGSRYSGSRLLFSFIKYFASYINFYLKFLKPCCMVTVYKLDNYIYFLQIVISN